MSEVEKSTTDASTTEVEEDEKVSKTTMYCTLAAFGVLALILVVYIVVRLTGVWPVVMTPMVTTTEVTPIAAALVASDGVPLTTKSTSTTSTTTTTKTTEPKPKDPPPPPVIPPVVVPTHPTRNECNTTTCLKFASRFMMDMDTDAKPCDDFYQAACGKYDQHSVTTGKLSDKREKLFNVQFLEILEGRDKTYNPSIEIAKKLFNVCRKPDGNDLRKANLLIPSPAFNGTNETEYVGELAKAGVTDFGFIKLDLSRLTEMDKTRQRVVMVLTTLLDWQPQPEYPTAGQAIVSHPNGTIKPFASWDSLELAPRDNNSDDLVSIKYLEGLLPEVPIMSILRNWFPPEANDTVIYKVVATYKYGDYLALRKKFLQANPRPPNFPYADLFHLAAQQALSTPFVKYMRDCHQMVLKTLPQPFAKWYDENEPNKGKVEKVKEMIKEYQDEYVEMLNVIKQDNKTDNTTDHLIEKVEGMKIVIGFPDGYVNKKLEEDIKGIDMTKMNNLSTAYPEVRRWQVQQFFKCSVEQNHTFPPMHNFFAQKIHYDGYSNTLYIYPPFLDGENFDVDYPPYVNYGGIGRVIGKEISDALTYCYRNYDKNGTFGTYWSSAFEQKYKESMECYINQYSGFKYTKSDKNLNGKTTLNENVADNLGAQVSYRLMKKAEKAKDVKHIPGLKDYTSDQIFFYSIAKRLCASPLDSFSSVDQMEDKPTTIGRFRANGMVSNMAGFADTFKCGTSDRMNPTQKCHVY